MAIIGYIFLMMSALGFLVAGIGFVYCSYILGSKETIMLAIINFIFSAVMFYCCYLHQPFSIVWS